MQFPYQIVVFFGREPEIGQFIYLKSPSGWLPNSALKRRFGLKTVNESELIKQLTDFAQHHPAFEMSLTRVTRPAHMPVEVVEIEPTAAVLGLHQALFDLTNQFGQSKSPEREGANFYPHTSISWRGERVVDPRLLEHKRFLITKLWLLKDDGDDSRAIAGFEMP